MPQEDQLYVCLTTVSNEEDAQSLADDVIESRLAACAQIEAPFTSTYRWQGAIERETEVRIALYALGSALEKLERFVATRHPYETPKWVCLRAEKVSEKYLNWANEACNLRGFV